MFCSLPLNIFQWGLILIFRGYGSHRPIGNSAGVSWHVTVWIIHFKSDCNSINKTVNKNLHVVTQFFFLIYILFGILSVNNDRVFLSIYTDEFNNNKKFVNKYHRKLYQCRKTIDNSFVFVEFLFIEPFKKANKKRKKKLFLVKDFFYPIIYKWNLLKFHYSISFLLPYYRVGTDY